MKEWIQFGQKQQMLLDVTGMCKKCKPGISEDSTLANSFQRALKWVSWFAGELHLAAVRIFVVFCFLDGEFMYLNSQKRICFNQSFKMPSIAEMQGEKNCRLCSHFI